MPIGVAMNTKKTSQMMLCLTRRPEERVDGEQGLVVLQADDVVGGRVAVTPCQFVNDRTIEAIVGTQMRAMHEERSGSRP